MKSKLFPQCKQRIHPVLNKYYCSSPDELNSGRQTQPDPQSCRNKQRIKRPKQKLSSATPNRDKTIHCQRKHRKKHPASNVAAELAPHPRHGAKACDNNTQTIPNNMVL